MIPPHSLNKPPPPASERNFLKWCLHSSAVGNVGGSEKKADGDAEDSKPLHIRLLCRLVPTKNPIFGSRASFNM